MANVRPRPTLRNWGAQGDKPATSPETSSAESSFSQTESTVCHDKHISDHTGSIGKVLDRKDQEHLKATTSPPTGAPESPVASSAKGLSANPRGSPKQNMSGSAERKEDQLYRRLEDNSLYPDLTGFGEDETDLKKRKGGPAGDPCDETSDTQGKPSRVNNDDERKSDNGFRSAFGWSGPISVLAGLLLLSAAFSIYKLLLTGPTEKLDPSPPIGFDYTDAKLMYQKEIKSLYKQHLDQEKTFWAKVLSGIDAINEESLVPHILLITGKPEARSKVEMLAKRLHSSFAKAMKKKPCPPLPGRDFKDRNLGDSFFDSVENCLRDRSILIEDIDDLHGAVAMHLHSFADNENAPFKTSAIFMTVMSDCEQKLEKCVKDLVMNKWGEEVEEDQISSLNSRIFNLVVRVR